jgi:hypothetical protein
MSRTFHPRSYGTHRAGHDLRENAKEDCRLPVRPDLTKAQAIAEYEPTSEPIDLPGLKRLGPIEWDNFWRGVRPRPEPWCEETERWLDASMDEWLDDERMASWEVDVLEGAEGACWTTRSGDDLVGSYAELYADVPDEPTDDDLDAADQSAWLTGDPRDFFDAVGDAWVVEGPSVTKPEPLRAGHYVRVYELAREVGIETKDLVRHLRLSGEYVRGAQSFVAVPVADRMNAIAHVLVETYGARKDAKRDPIAQLRVLLAEERRHALAKTRRPIVRPGAPRPGNNPFSLAYARSM